jgi:hypothetical protein
MFRFKLLFPHAAQLWWLRHLGKNSHFALWEQHSPVHEIHRVHCLFVGLKLDIRDIQISRRSFRSVEFQCDEFDFTDGAQNVFQLGLRHIERNIPYVNIRHFEKQIVSGVGRVANVENGIGDGFLAKFLLRLDGTLEIFEQDEAESAGSSTVNVEHHLCGENFPEGLEGMAEELIINLWG